jgi:hypothetical protein
MDAPANQAKRCFSRPWLTYFTATGVAQTPPDAQAGRPFDDSVKTALSGQALTINIETIFGVETWKFVRVVDWLGSACH